MRGTAGSEDGVAALEAGQQEAEAGPGPPHHLGHFPGGSRTQSRSLETTKVNSEVRLGVLTWSLHTGHLDSLHTLGGSC